MKKYTGLIAAILAFVIVFFGLQYLNGKNRNQTPEVESFASIAYERPDMDAITDQFEKTIAMHTDGTSLNTLMQELDTCYTMYVHFYTMSTVAEIRSYIDMTDTFYAEESAWCLNASAEMDQLFERLVIASANCDHAQELEERFWGDGLIDTYGGIEEGTYDDVYVELAQRESDLLVQYRTQIAEATVNYRGKETSFAELCADETLSDDEMAEIYALYYEKYNPILGEIYIDIIAVRQELADYLGFDSYEDYAYEWIYSRDYTPAEAESFLREIRTHLAPLYRELNVDALWESIRYRDMDETQILQTVKTAAQAMAGNIKDSFDALEASELYDISISENKYDISFQTYLDEYDLPFILVKTYGYDDDCLNVAHEFGHFVDAYTNCNATSSLELSETFSHSMEYLLLCYLPKDQLGDMERVELLNTLDSYTMQAGLAEFEHRVYAIPADELTLETVNQIAADVAAEYGYGTDGRDYAKNWVDITHFYEYPFYVISYSVSADTAFQIYCLECEESGRGLQEFNNLLPRDHDGFLETIETQSDCLESPFTPGRLEAVADIFREKLK